MYIPKHFAETDICEIEALVREFSFATLVSVTNGIPWATHIPLQLEVISAGEWLLQGHISRANPQWRNFNENNEVLAIFMGPHTYVSPSWYTKKNVPTWNYRAAHLYGKVRVVEGEALLQMLRTLMARYEGAHAQAPLAFNEIPADILQKDLNGLVGFEIKVHRIEAAAKLSQNRDPESYQNIIGNLKQMRAYDAGRIAAEMEKIRNTKDKSDFT